MVRHTEGCKKMAIGHCKDDAMRGRHTNTTSTSETFGAREYREMGKRGLDVTAA